MLSWSLQEEPHIATEAGADKLSERVNQLREREPDPFDATADQVETYLLEVRELLNLNAAASSPLPEAQARYIEEASMREVRFARARLEYDRNSALETLNRLFRMGTPPSPDGRYDGELVGLSTGLLSDPFFEWMTRIYLPWLGKTFDAGLATGDNVFEDNAWSKATSKLGWPEYRIKTEDLPDTVRVFPFRTYIAAGIEDTETQVLKIDYAHSPNPLPVRRLVDEVVELPGGYILGKAHMRGLRMTRRIAFFGLLKP